MLGTVSIQDHVVLSETVNTFKSRFDKLWQHQDMVYDFRAVFTSRNQKSQFTQ